VVRVVKWFLLAVLAVLVAGLVAVPMATASWHRRWGATDAEVKAVLPGDELLEGVGLQATRAVTIAARPEEVWPWIVQEGMDRAGWYTYDWFYKATGSAGFVDGHSSDRIVPELQKLKVGDEIHINKPVAYKVERMEPGHVLTLVLTPPDGKRTDMNYVLWPVDGGVKTRLVLRIAAEGQPTFWSSGPFEFGSFVMSRANLLGIKERAEKAAALANSPGK
jgi:hypothetical protein